MTHHAVTLNFGRDYQVATLARGDERLQLAGAEVSSLLAELATAAPGMSTIAVLNRWFAQKRDAIVREVA